MALDDWFARTVLFPDWCSSSQVRLPDMEFFVNLGDWPLEKRRDSPIPILSWCGSDETADIVMPTYDLTESVLETMGRYFQWKHTLKCFASNSKMSQELWLWRFSLKCGQLCGFLPFYVQIVAGYTVSPVKLGTFAGIVYAQLFCTCKAYHFHHTWVVFVQHSFADILKWTYYGIDNVPTQEVGATFNALHRYYSLRCLVFFLLIDHFLYWFFTYWQQQKPNKIWTIEVTKNCFSNTAPSKSLTIVAIWSSQRRAWDDF